MSAQRKQKAKLYGYTQPPPKMPLLHHLGGWLLPSRVPEERQSRENPFLLAVSQGLFFFFIKHSSKLF